MAIALPLIVHLFAPLQDAVEWLSGGNAPVKRANRSPAAQSVAAASDSANPASDANPDAASNAPPGPNTTPGMRQRTTPKARPTTSGRPTRAWGGPTRAPQTPAQGSLRVVRIEDGSRARASAGRMVISGRLADVCAELERLAALEAAAS